MLLRSVLLRDSFMLEKGASMQAYNRSTKHSSVEGMDVGTADGTADGTALGSDHLQKFLFVELLFEFGPAPLINVISRVYNGCTKLVSNSSIHCVTALVLSFVVLAI
jgi:hypothetical protein